MQRPSDTPPDGDFARYIEQLNAKAAARAAERDGNAAASHGRYQERTRAVAVERATSQVAGNTSPEHDLPKQLAGMVAGMSLWTVGKWVLIAWIALELLSAMLPRAGMLVLPLLLAFAAWAIYRFKKYSPELLKARLRELAEQAAKEFKQRK